VIRIASGHPADAFAAGSSPAGTTVRWVATILLALAMAAIAASSRTKDEPWRAGALLFGAYALLAPWYLYWHLIGLVALASVLTDAAIVRGTLTFSCSSLFVGSGGTAWGLGAQAAIRYVPPLVAAARGSSAQPQRGPASRGIRWGSPARRGG
jgi:hypothetical protein